MGCSVLWKQIIKTTINKYLVKYSMLVLKFQIEVSKSHFPLLPWFFFFVETTYLGCLATKSGWPPNIIHLCTCRIPYHYLVTFSFILWNAHPWSLLFWWSCLKQSGNTTQFSTKERFRKRWSWSLVISVKQTPIHLLPIWNYIMLINIYYRFYIYYKRYK